MNVLGLDLGLANAGAARLDEHGQIRTWRYTSPSLGAGASPAADAMRIREAKLWAYARANTSTVLVVIEELPQAATMGSHDQRAAVVHGVIEMFTLAGLLVATVNPTTLKHRIAGRGGATKDEMISAVDRLYPRQGLARVSDHQADGAGLATLGVARLAHIRGLPWRGPWLNAQSLNLEDGFRWPPELHTTPAERPKVPLPMFEVPSR